MTEEETTLEEQIRVVAGARKERDRLQVVKNVEVAKWEQMWKPLLDSIETTREEVAYAEALLRNLTLKAYNADPEKNKKPAEGVGIRDVTTYEYNSVNALDWAKSHKMALKLDTTAFEKLVKATPKDFKFVKPKTEPQATIATNLDEVGKS